jgi:hypothetical protein
MSCDPVPTMMDLYVYYKVREADATALAPRVRAMQAALAREGVLVLSRVQLKRRPDSKDDMQTWMEVYPGVAEDFHGKLAQAESRAGLVQLIAGPRRTEVFVDLDVGEAPCA